MAAPQKKGLDYFPFEVGFFSDKKIKRLRAKYGNDGICVLIYLYAEIYRDGYYIICDDDLILDISDELNISENSVKQILNYLFGRGLLVALPLATEKNTLISEISESVDVSLSMTKRIINFLLNRSLLNSKLVGSDKVLTAKSIQKRYQEAKKYLKRDVLVEAEYWLLNESETLSFIKVRPKNGLSEINSSKSEINSNKSENYPTKESKVNKSKVNESKAVSDTDAAFAAYCEKIEKSYLAVTGRKFSNSDISSIRSLYEKGCKAELIIRVIEDISGRKRNGKINSFNYFLSAINDEFNFDSNTADGRYPPTYDTQDIEAILDAEWMNESAGSDSDYDYDD